MATKAILASIDSREMCILLYAIDSPYLYPSSSLLVAVSPFHTFILDRHLSSERDFVPGFIAMFQSQPILCPLCHFFCILCISHFFCMILYAVFVLAMDNYDKYSLTYIWQCLTYLSCD